MSPTDPGKTAFLNSINLPLLKDILDGSEDLEEIAGCFTWSDAPEGHLYWEDFYNAVTSGTATFDEIAAAMEILEKLYDEATS